MFVSNSASSSLVPLACLSACLPPCASTSHIARICVVCMQLNVVSSASADYASWEFLWGDPGWRRGLFRMCLTTVRGSSRTNDPADVRFVENSGTRNFNVHSSCIEMDPSDGKIVFFFLETPASFCHSCGMSRTDDTSGEMIQKFLLLPRVPSDFLLA